jgi:hypothetical protein
LLYLASALIDGKVWRCFPFTQEIELSGRALRGEKNKVRLRIACPIVIFRSKWSDTVFSSTTVEFPIHVPWGGNNNDGRTAALWMAPHRLQGIGAAIEEQIDVGFSPAPGLQSSAALQFPPLARMPAVVR